MARSFDGPITELVPHRPPMLLIDRLLADDAELIRVEAVIKPDQLFLTEQGMPAWVGVELMAQTMAAWAGLRSVQSGKPVKLGFLLGTRRYDCTRSFFPVGARIEIEARQELLAENGLGVFICKMFLEGELLASAQLNAFQPPNVDDYLKGNING